MQKPEKHWQPNNPRRSQPTASRSKKPQNRTNPARRLNPKRTRKSSRTSLKPKPPHAIRQTNARRTRRRLRRNNQPPMPKPTPNASKHFRAIATENLNMAQEANPENAIADLDSKISKITETAEKTKGKPCEKCHQNFEKKLKRQKRSFQTIVLVEKAPDDQNNEQIDINGLVEYGTGTAR